MTEAYRSYDDFLDILSSYLELLHIGKGHFSDSELITYVIEHVVVSTSALIFFVYPELTRDHLVVKILKKHKDPRYNWVTLEERQASQQEAQKWNHIYSPHFTLKLTNICEVDLANKKLRMSNSENAMLDANVEYVLVMNVLPEDKRLDLLLKEQSEEALYQTLYPVTKRLIQMHTDLTALPIEEGERWGSLQQLQKKLEHNLDLADPIIHNRKTRRKYSKKIRDSFYTLKDNLRLALIKYPYQRYFEHRVREQRIKRCHGDLKCPNIWLDADQVTILDAIDFNLMYCNIDILSDFATFIIDAEAHISQADYVQPLMQQIQTHYLINTNQDLDMAAQSVLHYYFVEKAFIGAAISFVYDQAPELGQRYLEIAQTRLNTLMQN